MCIFLYVRAHVELWLQKKTTSRHKIVVFKIASINKHHLLTVVFVVLRQRTRRENRKMKRKRSGWRKWIKTDLSLVLFQLRSRWQGSFTAHLSLSKQIGNYLPYYLSSAFTFINVYLIKYSIECKPNVIAQYLFIFSISSLTWVSLEAKIFARKKILRKVLQMM